MAQTALRSVRCQQKTAISVMAVSPCTQDPGAAGEPPIPGHFAAANVCLLGLQGVFPVAYLAHGSPETGSELWLTASRPYTLDYGSPNPGELAMFRPTVLLPVLLALLFLVGTQTDCSHAGS